MFSDRSAFKILVVDDDEEDFFITNEYIKNISGFNFIIDWRYDYKTALADILDKKHDLYLIDYYLGAKTGLELIKEAIANHSDNPMIMLTGKGTPEIDAEAMHAGAVDFLIKGEMNTEKLERTIRHVIERSKGLRTLKSNERKFRHIFERTKDAIFLMDTGMNFIEVNQGTIDLFGYDREQLTGKNFCSLLAEEDKDNPLHEHMAKGEIEDRELRFVTGAGEPIWTVVSISREQDNYGTEFLQGIVHDISNLKKAEKTALRAEKMGMAERLVRTLAHEVRNPLNNINLSLEQLSLECKDEDAMMYLEIITRNSKRIEMLITELLGASRPEIELKPADLKHIVEESLNAANDRILLRHIKVSKTYPASETPVMADTEKLKIAFLNVIINAVEAMEEEGVLTISLEDEGELYKVMIADNGSGISPENLSRLFEPYFTAKKNGMGLGLAATMSIVQSHNATAEVSSELGAGSLFTISIPKQNSA